MYKARQIAMDRVVALKTLQGSPGTAPEVVARFYRDAKVAGALSHPDLVCAYASGETEGVHWVAMEFIEGTDAQARLKRKGKLALAEAVAIGTHVAGALDYGWRKAGIIHGSIKPETILLSKKSEVKLAGLGFGHGLGEMKPFAAEGGASGVVHYVSPERAEGKKDADLRADIYSLGCTLFHLMSGEPPYQGDTALALILHHVTMPVPELRAVRPECPAEISRVVMKMMHKLPAGRHQTYEELIADLRLCYEAATAAPAAAPAPAQAGAAAAALIPGPPRESISMPAAKPGPSRESIGMAPRQPAPVAKADVRQPEMAGERVILPGDAVAPDESPVEGKRRSLKKPLAIGGAALLVAIVALVCFGPRKKGAQLSEAERAERDRGARKIAGNPSASPVPKPAATKAPPARPKPTATPTPAKPAPATPKPAPAPADAPAPVPAAAAPQSATAKWLAEQEPQWQAAFAGEVSGPFEKGVADLNARYLVTLEHELATLPPSAERSAGAAFRAERARIAGGGAVPAEDESMAPPSLRAIRADCRAAFAKLETERSARAKTVHARTDAILAQTQAALTQRQRADEAQEIRTRRDALRDAWLKPPAGSAPAIAEARTATPEPAPEKPAPSVAPPVSKLPRLAPRALVERLLAMGATISIARPGGLTRVDKMADLPGDRFAIMKAEFIPHEGISAADLDIIEQLTDAEDVGLTGVPATDATVKLLRSLPELRVLGLRDMTGITPAGFRTIAALPALKTLSVRGPIGGESLSAFATNRKLDSLTLSDVTFAEQDFAAIAGIPALKTLTISTRNPVAPAVWARLAVSKKLATLNLENTPKTAEMIAQIARIGTLTTLSLGDFTLPDSDLSPLGSLKALHSLKTAPASTLDGSVFAGWPLHPAMKTLTLGSKSSVSDKALRGIAIAFPMLARLEVSATAGSVTPAGLAHLQKLRQLTYLTFTGDAVDAAGLVHVGSFEQLKHLGLGTPRVSDADVHLLAKLGSLHELEWSNPPVTDTALKGYAKLRGLTQFKIGNASKSDPADKLSTALPSVKVIP